jgi:hypothetical protein
MLSTKLAFNQIQIFPKQNYFFNFKSFSDGRHDIFNHIPRIGIHDKYKFWTSHERVWFETKTRRDGLVWLIKRTTHLPRILFTWKKRFRWFLGVLKYVFLNVYYSFHNWEYKVLKYGLFSLAFSEKEIHKSIFVIDCIIGQHRINNKHTYFIFLFACCIIDIVKKRYGTLYDHKSQHIFHRFVLNDQETRRNREKNRINKLHVHISDGINWFLYLPID